MARGRKGAASAIVTFPELAWAQYVYSREVREVGDLHGPAEEEFRRRLADFEASEGIIVRAFWGVNEAIGLALTEKKQSLYLARLLGGSPRFRLHRSTELCSSDRAGGSAVRRRFACGEGIRRPARRLVTNGLRKGDGRAELSPEPHRREPRGHSTPNAEDAEEDGGDFQRGG